MHYNDLAACHYHDGPFDAANWNVPLVTIGWLENPHAYSTGGVPQAFIEKLRGLVLSARTVYPHYYFRGGHECSLCIAANLAPPGPIWSQENIFVPGAACVYVAPGGIVHYVESHKYLPPQEFVVAVIHCPTYGTPEFQQAMREANRNQSTPLRTVEENNVDFQRPQRT
jgi:hypothetical protein